MLYAEEVAIAVGSGKPQLYFSSRYIDHLFNSSLRKFLRGNLGRVRYATSSFFFEKRIMDLRSISAEAHYKPHRLTGDPRRICDSSSLLIGRSQKNLRFFFSSLDIVA